MTTCPYGYWIVGETRGQRRLVDAAAAFAGYAACDERVEVGREAYLSAFTFSEEFRLHLQWNGSTKGYDGPCHAPWLWLDIDRPDLGQALTDARRLAAGILARYSTLDEGDLLVFFSGSKGFHVGLPTVAWSPEPSADFNRIARRFAERLAAGRGVAIDGGVYDKVRAFRAPNSRHPKTGLHKRRVAYDELLGLPLDRIRELAQQPEPFDLRSAPAASPAAVADWVEAGRQVRQEHEARSQKRRDGGAAQCLNRLTMDFIREGAAEGDRHRLLYSAAANLAEFGCPPSLAHALLTDAALDSGLPPGEVYRQIECGLRAVKEATTNV
jgi:hypothetical protein